MFRRILLPHLKPALGAAAVLAFFQSFENYNTTLFVRGVDNTLTVYIASKVRTGLTPAVNALGLILILLTVAGAVVYEILRRRTARADALAPAAPPRPSARRTARWPPSPWPRASPVPGYGSRSGTSTCVTLRSAAARHACAAAYPAANLDAAGQPKRLLRI